MEKITNNKETIKQKVIKMKVNQFKVALLAIVSVLAISCGNTNPAPKEVHDHKDHKDHIVASENTTSQEKVNKFENELGQALDAHGTLLMGCPIHKEMIGVKGDKCSKCDYMEMLPITWPLQGIDTVRVTNLPDYNPPVDKS